MCFCWHYWCWRGRHGPSFPQSAVLPRISPKPPFRSRKSRARSRRKNSTFLSSAPARRSCPARTEQRTHIPARLQQALVDQLKGVEVKVTTDIKARRTAAEMVKALPADLSAAKPALMIWQTGTTDAMLAVDPDQFSQALDQGINIARSAGADVVLVNAQYSPRTESMIALSTYSEDMRWVALQQEVPLFDRFSIMRLWSDLGTFDLYSATKKLDIAERVHDCIGRLLADLVIAAAKPEGPPTNGSR